MFYLLKKQGRLSALLSFFILPFYDTKAQINLVPNSSFEQYTNCPQGYLHDHPDFWYQPDKGGGGYLMLAELMAEMYQILFLVFSMPIQGYR